MRKKKRSLLILDANVLIDFCVTDISLLSLICNYVGQIYLPTPIFNEVSEINEDYCNESGIKLVEPELEQVALAVKEELSSLSFEDKLCLIMAKQNGWTCVTNDKPLRQKCEAEGVPLIWGVELICILVESGGLPAREARDVIIEIQNSNPKYITGAIVTRAFKRLGIKS
ncbi:conserved hypothetical protein [Syntrophomonas wolfei subsp. wolfei str. Goettingen G311]|uniref:PIN domain-containing protein n=1 Tax=Syntrophomonas wolfei subsp. wolfei (strain DSM 2245B / Goettingen) TaxID=335541 RepID=Q0AUR6_SYNWW|nr:conserved hypothetical protein [Syntrophomonas wolfei subsp. wolfei str. Goettingen G311]